MLKIKSRALFAGKQIALLAALMTMAQLGFIWWKGDAFCLNQGCKVVEQLTKVSPVVINLVGLIYFLLLFWGLQVSRNQIRRVPRFVAPLLLGGLAVEGVLIGFQYLVAQAFCFYCLSILAAVVLLNIMLGWRQLLHGAFIFSAVFLALASLKLNPVIAGQSAFKQGIFATRPGAPSQSASYLFYSSTCAHCQNVLAVLGRNPKIAVHLNPVDVVTTTSLPGVQINKTYSFQVNRDLLASLSIDEIPVLMRTTPTGLSVFRGEQAIIAAINQLPLSENAGQLPGLSVSPAMPSVIPGLDAKDGCQVAADCDSVPGTGGQPVVRP